MTSSRLCTSVAWLMPLMFAASGALADVGPARAASSSRIAPALTRRVEQNPGDRVSVWVFFTDRAGRDHDPAAFAAARASMSARSLARRARRGSIADVVASDLPVHQPYVRALVARGARLRGVSRWLNAASVSIEAREAVELARLPFVARLEPVALGRQPAPVFEADLQNMAPRGATGESHGPVAAPTAAPGDTAYYGASFKQLAMMQVPQLHAQGLSGAGVLVCMLDDGFRITHQCFTGLDVVAARDFINGDGNVDNDPSQDASNQGSHGTATLSCVAGSQPGTFSGAAFGASVALGKTEYDPTETPAEMDNWQFGAEWADSLGADVISSSLGYLGFDFPFPSYGYDDLDGRTTVVTLAAVEAARRGIVVVTANGNGGPRDSTLIAPADADSVVSSGAVDSLGIVASFSSHGPTADGRIKPDVMAMGRSVFLATFSNPTTYTRSNGTSFSTPLTAGLVALLLEAHPLWRPYDVIEALHGTATNHASPNNTYGWGLIQGLASKNWIPSATGAPEPAMANGIELSAGPNPMRAGAGATIRFTAPSGSRATLDLLDVQGRRRARLFAGAVAGSQSVRWNGRGDGARPLAAGVYWLALETVHGAQHAQRTLRVAIVP
jgi:hypothetical protein